MKALVCLVVFAAVGAVNGTPGFFNFFKSGQTYDFEKLPDFKNYAAMARFLVHISNYTAVSYRSSDKEFLNLAVTSLFSLSDGFMSNSTGIPYFFVTELEPAVRNLVRNDSRCGLMMSLAQSGICDKRKWDAEDPRCTRVYLTGNFQVLKNNTAEYDFAKKVFTNRHPLLAGMPGAHKFFYAKYDIKTVNVISGLNGLHSVSLKEYKTVKDPKFNLYPTPIFD